MLYFGRYMPVHIIIEVHQEAFYNNKILYDYVAYLLTPTFRLVNFSEIY